jgi:hypothetical protein
MKLEELLEVMDITKMSISDAKTDDGDIVVKSMINNVMYELRFYPAVSDAARFAGAKDNMWAFSFKILTSRKSDRKEDSGKDFKMQNFNNGSEFKVMPVVMGYIVDFIKKKKPEAFMFAADKQEGSRGSLYGKLVKKYSTTLDQLGYRVMTDKETHMDGHQHMKPFMFIQKRINA